VSFRVSRKIGVAFSIEEKPNTCLGGEFKDQPFANHSTKSGLLMYGSPKGNQVSVAIFNYKTLLRTDSSLKQELMISRKSSLSTHMLLSVQCQLH
jgi:hypothetical protein